jgi:hypothetical protein
MTAKEAKQIAIDEILSKFGHEPCKEKKSGDELWYCSPFRDEKTPSFKVTLSKNLFYDFGEGRGGTALDLVMYLLNTDLRDALRWCREFSNADVINSVRPLKRRVLVRNKKEDNPLELIKEKALKNAALIDYISSRYIDIEVARRYAVEVYYHNKETGKRYFGVGLKNVSGGYAVRNKYCKSLVGLSDISFVNGEIKDGRIDLFEGFFDFLSHCSINLYFPKSDALVLNSTSHYKKAIAMIKKGNYNEVNLYQDNDEGGKKLLEQLKKELSNNIYIRSQAHLYQNTNDLNAYWRKVKG